MNNLIRSALIILMAALLVACGGPTEPDLYVQHGSSSQFVPAEVSEMIVMRGGEPVPFRIVTEQPVCEVGGSEIGSEEARTIVAVNGLEPRTTTTALSIETRGGIVAVGECEAIPSENRVRLRW